MKSLMQALCILLCVLSLVQTVVAADTPSGLSPDWVFIDDNGGNRLYYNRDSLRRTGDIVRVWLTILYAEPDQNGLGRISALNDFHCTNRSSRVVQVVQHYTNGRREEQAFNDSFEPVVEQSLQETTLDKLCNQF